MTNRTKPYTVKSNGKTIRTWDNPLNLWVRDLATGQLVRTDILR